MLKLKEIVEIKIDSLIYGGEGIGKIDGLAVFVADSAPGDLLKIEIIASKKNYAKGKILEIIEPSVNRIKPFCALANTCGGCQWQHVDYDSQLKAKKQIVEESLKKISGMDILVKDVIASPKIEKYRYKVQYPVGQTKISKRILAGYYKKGSHDIVNIKYCEIQPEIINEITAFIREEAAKLELTAYNEQNGKGLLRHLVFRASSTKNQILAVLVVNDKKINPRLIGLAELIQNKFKIVTGVLANFNTTRTNVIMGAQTEVISGKDYIEENLMGLKYKISAGSFFQVNPASAVNIFNVVKNIVRERLEKPTVLDVYAGVGSFAIWLKDVASQITAIETYPTAVKDAKENIKANNADNIEMLEGDALLVLQDMQENEEKFDVVILDPPRKGCDEETLEIVAELAQKYIIYVSCNPATLARDLKFLKEKGFTPEFAQPVDMFCHTYHIESVVVLKNCNN